MAGKRIRRTEGVPDTLHSMYCRACGYVIDGLGKGSCPECGREFDPSDASSYDAFPRQHKRATLLLWIPAAWPLVPAVWLYAMFLVGRIVTGHWPGAHGGADDPKSMPVVSEMHIIHLLMLLSVPLSVVALVVRGVLDALEANARNSPFRFWRLLAAATVWLLGMVALCSDPLHVWQWWLD